MSIENEIEKQIIRDCVSELNSGTFQEWQLEQRLRMKGVASFRIGNLSKKIKEQHRKTHHCF